MNGIVQCGNVFSKSTSSRLNRAMLLANDGLMQLLLSAKKNTTIEEDELRETNRAELRQFRTNTIGFFIVANISVAGDQVFNAGIRVAGELDARNASYEMFQRYSVIIVRQFTTFSFVAIAKARINNR